MNVRLLPFLVCMPLLIAAASPVPPREQRGRDGADCRANESGPAFRVKVEGLKDRSGRLSLELYPANDDDFLAADKQLIAEGKTFRRVLARPPSEGSVTLCIRAPRPGRYAISLLHDRDSNWKFGFFKDGIGFANNPELGRKKPAADEAAVAVGDGVATVHILMNYRRGFGMKPLPKADRDNRG